MTLLFVYSLRILPPVHSPNGFEDVYKPLMVSCSTIERLRSRKCWMIERWTVERAWSEFNVLNVAKWWNSWNDWNIWNRLAPA